MKRIRAYRLARLQHRVKRRETWWTITVLNDMGEDVSGRLHTKVFFQSLPPAEIVYTLESQPRDRFEHLLDCLDLLGAPYSILRRMRKSMGNVSEMNQGGAPERKAYSIVPDQHSECLRIRRTKGA